MEYWVSKYGKKKGCVEFPSEVIFGKYSKGVSYVYVEESFDTTYNMGKTNQL